MRLLTLAPLFLLACTQEDGSPLPTDTAAADTAPEVAEVFEPTRMYIHMDLLLKGGQPLQGTEPEATMGLIFTGPMWWGDRSPDVGNHCTIVWPASAMSVDLTPAEGRLARVTTAPDSEYTLVGADCANLPDDAWGGETLDDIAARGIALFLTGPSGMLDPVMATTMDETGMPSYLEAHIEWDGDTRLMAGAGVQALDDRSAYLDAASLEELPGDVFVEVYPSQYFDRPLP